MDRLPAADGRQAQRESSRYAVFNYAPRARADACFPKIGTSLESDLLRDVVIQTAREPLFASTFNYASMAFNNHFYFQSIVRGPPPGRSHLRASGPTA